MATETEGEDIMVYLPGSEQRSFRCTNDDNTLSQCGCNVFRRKQGDSTRLVCNSCRAVYVTALASDDAKGGG
jgi:hypothetical protein